MRNWIIWLPAGSYWQPRNLMEVWSRGVEFNGDVGRSIGRTRVKLGVMTSYVRSTNQRATSVNDASVGKQLIYVPMYSGGGRLSARRGAFSAGVDVHYTGYRYTSSDNRSFLSPYWLANADAAWRFHAGRKCLLSFGLQAFNLFDEQYQVMLNRPMPMRSFQATLRMQFHQPLREDGGQ
jgi:iron complex outermembrane receptor protein